MTVADRIKELRTDAAISQARLAKQIGVTQKAVDFWEKGINEPKATYIVRIADYFGVTTDFLLGRNDF